MQRTLGIPQKTFQSSSLERPVVRDLQDKIPITHLRTMNLKMISHSLSLLVRIISPKTEMGLKWARLKVTAAIEILQRRCILKRKRWIALFKQDQNANPQWRLAKKCHSVVRRDSRSEWQR